MTCRHAPGDPKCSSYPAWKAEQDRVAELERLAAIGKAVEAKENEWLARTPNPEEFEVDEVEEVGPHLVMRVKYSSCEKCSFDSKKVMVFLDTTIKDAIRWRQIDPHFAEKGEADPKVAPPPRARFPADAEGWADAIAYAESKTPT